MELAVFLTEIMINAMIFISYFYVCFHSIFLFSLLGYALQRNEQMVDRILLECVKYKIIPDIVLFNGAIDAYIR